MIHLANILIAAADPVVGHDCQVKLSGHGYQCRVVTSLGAIVSSVDAERPEAVLVVGDFPADELSALRGNLGAGTDDLPICFAPLHRSAAVASAAIGAGIDDVIPPPLNDAKLIGRLRPLVRLAIMRSELHLRAATARRFGIETAENVGPVALDPDYPVLVVGPGDARLNEALAGAHPTFAADPVAAEQVVTATDFDAAILVPTGQTGAFLDFCGRLRNNPRLFNLPVVILGEPGAADQAEVYRHGANGYFERPVDPLELRAALLALVRQQRLRWSIRRALNATVSPPTRDLATAAFDPAFLDAYLADRVRSREQATRDLAANIYSRAFLDSYLADRVEFALAHSRHLSLMHFRLADQTRLRAEFGSVAAEHLRSQIAQWITGLLRGEDLTARFEADEFCVVLPDTPKEEADIVMNRIVGVLAYTDFAVMGVFQPVKAWVQAGSASLRPGDTVAGLTARARETIVLGK